MQCPKVEDSDQNRFWFADKRKLEAVKTRVMLIEMMDLGN